MVDTNRLNEEKQEQKAMEFTFFELGNAPPIVPPKKGIVPFDQFVEEVFQPIIDEQLARMKETIPKLEYTLNDLDILKTNREGIDTLTIQKLAYNQYLHFQQCPCVQSAWKFFYFCDAYLHIAYYDSVN